MKIPSGTGLAEDRSLRVDRLVAGRLAAGESLVRVLPAFANRPLLDHLLLGCGWKSKIRCVRCHNVGRGQPASRDWTNRARGIGRRRKSRGLSGVAGRAADDESSPTNVTAIGSRVAASTLAGSEEPSGTSPATDALAGDTLARGRIRTAGQWPLPLRPLEGRLERWSRTSDSQITRLVLYPLS